MVRLTIGSTGDARLGRALGLVAATNVITNCEFYSSKSVQIYAFKKYQKCAKMGSPKSVKDRPLFVTFEHWGTPGHPHGSQSFQKRPKEASKKQFVIIFASIFTSFGLNLHTFSTHLCSNFATFCKV